VADYSINGASFRQILVMIDGVQLNSLADNVANIGAIPVQQIKRIEIIKGPGSSSWGPALGGVINIVTKDPNEDAKISGTLSSSLGERGTGDYRGEVSGSLGRFGYFISGGKLTSAGLTPNDAVDENNVYTKLKWDLAEKGALIFTLGYDNNSIGVGQSAIIDFTGRDHTHDFFSTLALQYPLSDTIDLELSGRMRTSGFSSHIYQLSNGADIVRTNSDEEIYGASVKLNWRQRRQSAVIGFDYDHGKLDADDNIYGQSLLRRTDKWGIFVNDTITIGPFAITPGLRYDHTNYDGDFTSASTGITYNLTKQTLLRAYVGKGYSIPSVILNFAKEDIIAYQAGFESADIPYLLFKATYFKNYTTDAISSTTGASEKQVKEGVEAEIRTLPFYYTSLFAGFNFVDARSRRTDAEIPGIARYTWNLGIYYDDGRSFHGALTGHFIWWNNDDTNTLLPGRYNSFIWDLNLSKKIFTHNDNSAELFFTAHNIFNGSQYEDGAFPSPRRWFEGGVRLRF